MENKKIDFHEIKTFEDACRHLGISEDTELLVTFSGDMEAFLQASALYKLLIIQKAINNGKWRDEEGWSYFPYWMLYSKEEMEYMIEEVKLTNGIRQLIPCAYAYGTDSSGVRCSVTSHRSECTYYGLPLCFNSEEVARYVGRQFEDLFFLYYGIKVKE